MTIAVILKGKGTDVVSLAPRDTVGTAARTLAEHRIGAVLVRDAAGKVLGILSERDIVRGLARHGDATERLDVTQLMTRDLVTVRPETPIADALALMTNRRVRHLPVLEAGVLAGMVSIGDLVKARIEQAVHEAEELKAYVATAG